MFFIDDLLSGSAISLIHKIPILQSIRVRCEFTVLIWKGLLLTDYRLPTYQRAWIWISRFSWELPQTTLGFLLAMILNWTHRIDRVSHLFGSTLLKLNGIFGGMCLSPFIVADERVEGRANNHLFQHEFGHVLQSRIWGPLFLIRIGLPSLISAMKNNYQKHMAQWPEQDANKRSNAYFKLRNLKSYSWDHELNPILKA